MAAPRQYVASAATPAASGHPHAGGYARPAKAVHYEPPEAAHPQPDLRAVPAAGAPGEAHRGVRRAYTGPVAVEYHDPSALAMLKRHPDRWPASGAAPSGGEAPLSGTPPGTPSGSGPLAGRVGALAEARVSLSSSTYAPSASSSARAAPRAEAAPAAPAHARPTPAQRQPVGLDSPRRSRDVAGADTPHASRLRPVPPSPGQQQQQQQAFALSVEPSPEPPPRSRHVPQGAADAVAQMQLQTHQYAAAHGADRAPTGAEARATGRQPAHPAPDGEDVRYLKKNVDHLKQKKRFLEDQVKQLDARLKNALEEKEFFRGLFEQVQTELRESRYTNMPEHNPGQELQELQMQLQVATELKGQFYRETEELRDQLRQAQQGGGKDESSCVVCMDNLANVVCLPCRHLALCSDCSGAVDACPICRTAAAEKLQIFTP